eukprot:252918_1
MSAAKSSRWKCKSCGNRNRHNLSKCNKCQEPKRVKKAKKKHKTTKKPSTSTHKSTSSNKTQNVNLKPSNIKSHKKSKVKSIKQLHQSESPIKSTATIATSKPQQKKQIKSVPNVSFPKKQSQKVKTVPHDQYMLFTMPNNINAIKLQNWQNAQLDDEQEEESNAIVIDVGTYATKAGHAGQQYPSVYICRNDSEFQVNKYPMQECMVTDWNKWQHLIENVVHERLHVTPEEHPIFMTEPPLNPKWNREKMTQIVFEHLNCPSYFISIKNVLGLYAYGHTTGIVIDSGYDTTHCVAIYEGYALPHNISTIPIGGKHVTEYLMKHLPFKSPNKCTLISGFYNDLQKLSSYSRFDNQMYVNLTSSYFGRLAGLTDIAERIKRQSKYVYIEDSIPCYNDYNKKGCKNVELPDGSIIEIDEAVLKDCTEKVLFNKNSNEYHLGGIWYNTQMYCDVDIRRVMRENTFLIGGNTVFENMDRRVQKEMECRGPIERHRCYGKPNREIFSWIGGSILASLSTFTDMWITKMEYDESGPDIVHRKCF